VTVLKTEDVVFAIGWPYVFVMWLSICEWEPQGSFFYVTVNMILLMHLSCRSWI